MEFRADYPWLQPEVDPSIDLFDQQEWGSAMETLKSKGAEFTELYARVLATRSKVENNPVLLAEYESLIKRGDLIKKSVSSATTGVDIFFPFVKPFLSLFDLLFNKPEVNNLNAALPLVSIAVITTSIAAITYWITDATKYLAKVSGEVLTSPNFLIIGVGILALLMLTRKRST